MPFQHQSGRVSLDLLAPKHLNNFNTLCTETIAKYRIQTLSEKNEVNFVTMRNNCAPGDLLNKLL